MYLHIYLFIHSFLSDLKIKIEVRAKSGLFEVCEEQTTEVSSRRSSNVIFLNNAYDNTEGISYAVNVIETGNVFALLMSYFYVLLHESMHSLH